MCDEFYLFIFYGGKPQTEPEEEKADKCSAAWARLQNSVRRAASQGDKRKRRRFEKVGCRQARLVALISTEIHPTTDTVRFLIFILSI